MRSLRDVLQVTNDTFVAGLKARQGFKLPQRQIIVAGNAVDDCEQLAVWTTTGVYPGFPGSQLNGYQTASGGFVPLSTNVNVSLYRDVPNIDNAGRIPLQDDLTKASLSISDDGQALAEVFWDAYNANLLAPFCDNIAGGSVTFLGPLGGILEARLSFSIQL